MAKPHTPKKSVRQSRTPDPKPTQSHNQSVTHEQAKCYAKWLQLKASKEYREASQEIRRLQERQRVAEERFGVARDTYLPFLQ